MRPDEQHFRNRLNRAFEREYYDLGALRVAIERIPRLAHNLTHAQRIIAAELCRDVADAIEQMK